MHYLVVSNSSSSAAHLALPSAFGLETSFPVVFDNFSGIGATFFPAAGPVKQPESSSFDTSAITPADSILAGNSFSSAIEFPVSSVGPWIHSSTAWSLYSSTNLSITSSPPNFAPSGVYSSAFISAGSSAPT